MKKILLLAALILAGGCSNQHGNVAGTIGAPSSGARITASQNGQAISSVVADPRDGRFTMKLSPGIYNVSVSVPAAPFPMMFQNISVQSGKTTDLANIEMPGQHMRAAPGSLSGSITPATAGAKILLVKEGNERAVATTDSRGEYLFTGLVPGPYVVKAIALNYSHELLPVLVSGEKATIQNIKLLYETSIKGVDWAAGKIRVTGIGLPPANAPNQSIRRQMAYRSALADAQRKLVGVVSQIKTGPDKSLSSEMGEKNFSRKIQGFIGGYTIVNERESGGKVEIDVELPLTGQRGLARYLAE